MSVVLDSAWDTTMVTLSIVDPAGMSPNFPDPSNPPTSNVAVLFRFVSAHVDADVSESPWVPSTAFAVFAHDVLDADAASTTEPRTFLIVTPPSPP
jgi:hypothetical protein